MCYIFPERFTQSTYRLEILVLFRASFQALCESQNIVINSFFFYKNAETRVTALLTSLEDNLVAVAGGGLQI